MAGMTPLELPALSSALSPTAAVFDWPIRVYYEDSDAGGIVYHSQYLNFMERARTEWLRALGFEQTELIDAYGILFVVRHIDIQYKKPARFNDAVLVRSQLTKLGRSRFIFEQTILRGADVLTLASVEVVCISADRYQPVPLPEAIQNILQATLMESQ